MFFVCPISRSAGAHTCGKERGQGCDRLRPLRVVLRTDGWTDVHVSVLQPFCAPGSLLFKLAGSVTQPTLMYDYVCMNEFLLTLCLGGTLTERAVGAFVVFLPFKKLQVCQQQRRRRKLPGQDSLL